jgi:hypothetical protein
MSNVNKRKVTVSFVALAGVAVVVALCLTANQKASVASSPGPTVPAVDPPRVEPVVTPPVVSDPPVPTVSEKVRPQVDVVFALDTTGSMGGLIEGAKRKIWSIANQLQSGQPKPDVRIGLVGYRDLGDEYVTRRFPLSEDMEDVYSNLRQFRADGGGDTPEHVNRALADAVRRMQWREGQNVLRLIFLVGDAPPHEGREGLYSRDLTAEAARKGIVVNAVRCGSQSDTEAAWTRIAAATGGMYSSVQQDGAMVAVSTPLDSRLTELNARLSATVLPTGSAEVRMGAARRMRINAAMDGVAQAESARFRASSGKVDSADLLTVMAKGKRLESLKDEELPSVLAGKSREEQKAYVAKVARERAEIQTEVDKLSKEREAIIRAKRPKATSFDDTIGHALKKQGARAGIAY